MTESPKSVNGSSEGDTQLIMISLICLVVITSVGAVGMIEAFMPKLSE
jgi:hypothetical protein